MSDATEKPKMAKPSRGNYYVVYVEPSHGHKVIEFKTKREMGEWLKPKQESPLERDRIVAIFKGRRLEISVKHTYKID